MPKPFTPETAAEAGRKGRQAQLDAAERRKKDPVSVVREALPELFESLLKAARGLPPFDDLPAEKRLAALTKALEYGAGRPVAVDKSPGPSGEGGEAEEPHGLTIV